MKTLLATLALTLSASAFSAKVPSAAFTETYIKKNSNVTDTGVNYTTHRTLNSWCSGMASPVSFGTYEAAEKFDSMTDGLYRCDGKFVQVPNERQNPITIFAINGCSEVNPAELKSECPAIK